MDIFEKHRACAGVEARAGVPLSSALLQECQAALTALQSRNKFASKVNAALLEGWASIDSEYAPVSAVCGGILGQEVGSESNHDISKRVVLFM